MKNLTKVDGFRLHLLGVEAKADVAEQISYDQE
jgi:hypothetical protein